jgi:predicted peptidase
MQGGLGWAVFFGLAVSTFAQAPSLTPQSRPAPASRDSQIGRQKPMPHLLYLPPGYGKDGGGKLWPVVLFLHGMGESGHDLERVKIHGPPKLVSQGKQFPFILVSPQTDHGWKPSELGQLLDSIESQYAVDRSREYVTGLSMGGFGTWAMLAEFPNRFAAAVMICGGGDPAKAASIKDTPLWVFHGEKDDVVPIERSRADVEALEKLGAEVRFTAYPDAKHDSWTATYSNPKVYRWMLKHRRTPTGVTTTAPAAITAGTRPAH